VTTSFTSTFASAENLSASSVGREWRVLVALSLFLGATVIGLLYAVDADYKDHAKANSISKGEKKNGDENLNAVNALEAPNSDLKETSVKRFSLSVMMSPATVSKIMPLSTAVPRRRKIVRWNQQRQVRSDLAILEESLPRSVRSGSTVEKCAVELKQHHRWMCIVFYYSESFSRMARVLSLASNVLIMLFIQSLTYNLTNPDDGSCKTYNTENKCLRDESAFATGESKCAWESRSGDVHHSGQCSFVEPDSSMEVVLFVAVFSALVTTPLALLTDWIIRHYLAAPVGSASQSVAPVTTAAITDAQANLPVALSSSGAAAAMERGAVSVTPRGSSTEPSVPGRRVI